VVSKAGTLLLVRLQMRAFAKPATPARSHLCAPLNPDERAATRPGRAGAVTNAYPERAMLTTS